MHPKESLQNAFHYNPITGVITDKMYNEEAGVITIDKRGYKRRIISFRGKKYKAHQLAFLFMAGYIPKIIDHKDRNSLNNKWSNLRDATQSQNFHNTDKKITNTTGFKNVWFHKQNKNYVAEVWINRKKYHIGCFSTAELAYEAAQNFRKRHKLDLTEETRNVA